MRQSLFSRKTVALAGALAGIGCLGGATAHAQTTLSVYTGTSSTQSSDLRIRQPALGTDAVFRGVRWEGKPFENPLYYGYRITHFLKNRPNLGFGIDFTHYKIYAKTGDVLPVSGTWQGAPVNERAPLNQRIQEFSISHGVNTLGVNVYYRFNGRATERYPQGRLQPYLGAGINYYILHPENTINGVENEERYQGSGYGLQFLGGAQYGITPRIGFFLEFKYDSGKAKGDTASGGSGETDVRTTHLLGGISYRL